MTFTCGHEGEIPRNMGRGARREARITEYFGRMCMTCAIDGACRSVLTYTRHAVSLESSIKAAETHIRNLYK